MTAMVEVDDLGLVEAVHLTPGCDMSPVRLEVITRALNMLRWLCLWSLDRSRLGFSANKVDLTTFTDDEKQKYELLKKIFVICRINILISGIFKTLVHVYHLSLNAFLIEL